MTKIKESRLLITGGASGIGRIMGRQALQRGAKEIVVWDINEQNIAATAEEFSAIGNVKGYRVDVGNVDAIREAYTKVKKECGDVDILINNAGMAYQQLFQLCDNKKVSDLFNINIMSAMELTKELLVLDGITSVSILTHDGEITA